MNWLKRIILSLSILFIYQSLLAQSSAYNEGLTSPKIDLLKGANALIILDSGNYSITPDYNLLFQHSQQIKILTEKGLAYAIFEIPFSKDDSLISFTGKIVSSTKENEKSLNIEPKDFKLKVTASGDYIARLKLDQAKVGDTLSFNYKLKIKGLENINNWYFQNDIPVKKSSITLKFPSFIFYYKFLEGQRNLTASNRSIVKELIGKDQYNFQLETYTMEDIPAYIFENDVPGEDYFISKLTLHLAEHTLPGQETKYFLPSTYEDLAYNWAADQYFDQINKYSSYLAPKIEEIYHKEFSNEKNIRSFYYFIRNNFTTDNSFYDNDLAETYKRRSGNEQQINMLLAKILNQAGFDAYMVAISTIDNRPLYPANPYFSLFNKFIVMVKVYNQTYFLDASDPQLLFNMLTPNSISSGLVISKVSNGLLPLQYLFDDREAVSAQIKLTDSASLVVDYHNTRSGYSLYSFDSKFLENYKSYNDYLIETIFNNPSWQIISHEMEEEFDQNKVLKESLKFSQSLVSKKDMIYIPTSFNNDFYENPYPDSQRQNPITLYTPIFRKGRYTVTIPENYSIQTIPSPVIIALPDEGGSFKYEVAQNGKKIEITYFLDVKKVIYLSNEYPVLSEFFARVSKALQQEILVEKN